MLDWQRHKKLRLFIRTICVVLIVTFLSYDLAWAGATEVFSSRNQRSSGTVNTPPNLEIPQQLGIIKDSYISKTNPYKLVIHIQDAHANVEAQENEAKLIKHLKEKCGVNLISVEGGFGDFEAEFFRTFPKDKKVRERIAKYFLSKSFISGPDYLLITENAPPAVYGAEDRELYTAHLNTFKQNQDIASSLNHSLSTLEGVITTLKDKYYSKDLKELDSKINDFRQDRISLEEYLSYLYIASIINNVDLSKFPNLYSIITSQELEHKIDFSKAETERQDLIDSLTKALSKQGLEELIKNSLNFKANKITPAEYYAYLEKLTKDAGIQANTYNNLFTYIKYVTVSQELDNSRVFDEMDEFTKALKEKLAATSVEKDIDNLTYIIRIFKGLSEINLSPKEYEHFKNTKEEFNQRKLTQLFKRYVDSSYLKSLPTDEEIASLEKFYQLAHDRDEAIVKNSLNRLNRDYSSNSVIIVAGGFHTQGITSILKEKDISYLVIAPNIKTTPDRETLYFSFLKDKRLPLQDVLNDPDTLQIINSISDAQARELLITYWITRASRYYSLEELQAQLDKINLSSDDQNAVKLALESLPASHGKSKIPPQHGSISSPLSTTPQAPAFKDSIGQFIKGMQKGFLSFIFITLFFITTLSSAFASGWAPYGHAVKGFFSGPADYNNPNYSHYRQAVHSSLVSKPADYSKTIEEANKVLASDLSQTVKTQADFLHNKAQEQLISMQPQEVLLPQQEIKPGEIEALKQETLAQQKVTQEALEKLQAQETESQATIEAAQQEIEKARQENLKAKQAIEKLSTEQKDAQTKINALEDKNKALEDNLSTLKEDLDRFEKGLSEAQEKIDNFEKFKQGWWQGLGTGWKIVLSIFAAFGIGAALLRLGLHRSWQRLRQLKEEINQKKEEIIQLDKERDASSQELKRLKIDLDQLQKDIEAKTKEHSSIVIPDEQKLTTLKEGISQLEKDQARYEKAIQDLKKKTEEYQDTIKALEQQKDKSIQELAVLKDASLAKEEIKETNKKLAEAQETLQKLKEEIARYQTKKTSLESAIPTLTQQSQKLSQLVAGFNIQKESLTQKETQLRQNIETRTLELKSIEQRIADLQTTSSEGDTEITPLKKQKQDLEEEIAKLSQNIADLSNEASKTKGKLDELNFKISALTIQKAQLDQEIDILVKKKQKESEGLGKIIRDKEDVSKKAEFTQQQLNQTNAQLQNLIDSLEELKQRGVNLSQEIPALTRKRDALQEELNNLGKLKQELEASIAKTKQDAQKSTPQTPSSITLPQPYAVMIFDIDRTITDTTTPIEDEILEELFFFLAQGVRISLVSVQGKEEIQRYILEPINAKYKDKFNLLKNLVIYPAGGAQCYRFDKEGNLIDKPVYDVLKNTIFEADQDSVKKAVEVQLGSSVRITTKEQRNGVITIDGISDRAKAVASLTNLFIEKGWHLIPRLGGKATIHILVGGVSKTKATEHFLNEVERIVQQQIPFEQILFIGDSFYSGGLDADLISALPEADIVSVGKKPLGDELKNLQKLKVKFSEDLVGTRNWQASLKILKEIRKGKSINNIANEKSRHNSTLTLPGIILALSIGIFSLFPSLTSAGPLSLPYTPAVQVVQVDSHTEDKVKQLIEDLKNVNTRQGAIKELAKIGAPVVRYLVEGLSLSYPLITPDFDFDTFKQSCQKALDLIGESSKDTLITMAKDKDLESRLSHEAIEQLARFKDEDVINVLYQILTTDKRYYSIGYGGAGHSLNLNREAADSLVKIGNKSAKGVLYNALNNDDQEVRKATKEALAKIGEDSLEKPSEPKPTPSESERLRSKLFLQKNYHQTAQDLRDYYQNKPWQEKIPNYLLSYISDAQIWIYIAISLAGIITWIVFYAFRRNIRVIYKQLLSYAGQATFKEKSNLKKAAISLAKKIKHEIYDIHQTLAEKLPEVAELTQNKRIETIAKFINKLNQAKINSTEVLRHGIPLLAQSAGDEKEFEKGLLILENTVKELHKQNINIDSVFGYGLEPLKNYVRDFSVFEATCNLVKELVSHKQNHQEILTTVVPQALRTAKDANLKTARLNTILQLLLGGIHPTQALIESIEKTTSQSDLTTTLAQWSKLLKDFKTGAVNFDIKNPLHVDLEYTTYRKLASQLSWNNSYQDYQNTIKQFESSSGYVSNLSDQEQSEIKLAVYEAYRLLEFILAVKVKADQLGRAVWVIPNLSYGKFAVSPILDELAKAQIEVHYTKVGSGESHEHPELVKPALFTDDIYSRILKERPVIIVVDGTQHLLARVSERKSARYPDAYVGYRNFMAALDEVLSGKQDEKFQDKVKVNKDFLNTLRSNPDYTNLVNKLKNLNVNLDQPLPLYRLEFWNPGGLELVVREARKEVQNVTPFDPKTLDSPALIFINSPLLDEDTPAEIKKWANLGQAHVPAFFDDRTQIQQTSLAVNERGIYLSHGLEFVMSKDVQDLKVFYKDKLPKVTFQAPTPESVKSLYEVMLFDLDGTLTDTLSEIDKSLLNKVIYFLSSGIPIAIITSQSLDEVKKYVLDKVDKDKRNTLQSLIVYTARGAQSWGFDQDSKPYSIFDRSQTDINPQQHALIRQIVPQALGSLSSDSEITDRQAQITIRLAKHKDKRDLVSATLNQLITDNNLPFLIEYSGSSTIHIILKNINKGTAKDHFLTQIIPTRLAHQVDPSRILIVGDSFKDGGSDRSMMVQGARIVSVGKEDKGLPQGIEVYPKGGWKGTNQLLGEIIHKAGRSSINLPSIFVNILGLLNSWPSLSETNQDVLKEATDPFLYIVMAVLGAAFIFLSIITMVKFFKTYRLYSQLRESINFLDRKDRIILFKEINRRVSWQKIQKIDPYQLLIEILPSLAKQTEDKRILEMADVASYLKNVKINPRYVFKYCLPAIVLKTADEKAFTQSLNIAKEFAVILKDKHFDYQLIREILPSINRTARDIEELNEAMFLGIALVEAGRSPAFALTRMLPEVSSLTKTIFEFRLGVYALKELCLKGFEPTGFLIQALIKLGAQNRIDREIINWQETRHKFKSGEIAFNPEDKLHVNLEYTTFRELVDRTLKQSHRYSFGEYLEILKNFNSNNKRAHLSHIEKAEIKYAAYEAYRLRQFILEVSKQAKKINRSVWVVPNLSYGRFAVSPILKDLAQDGIEIHPARIGSTESHDNPRFVNPDLFNAALYDRILNEQPIIIVVDGTQHLLARPKDRKSGRYPDAYVGYRNLIIAVNDIISAGQEQFFKHLVKTRGRFIEHLRKKSDYKKLRRRLLRIYLKDLQKKHQLYDVEFWNPGGLDLAIREARQEVTRIKPIEANEIIQPTLIFVNSVLLDEDTPVFVREWISKEKKIRHKPAYFDDTSHIQSLIFNVDTFGVSLSDSLYRNVRNEYRRIKSIYRPVFSLSSKPQNLAKLPYKAVISDLDGTLSDTLEEIPRPIMEKLLYLLQLGLQVAIVTTQSYKEVEKYLLRAVPKNYRPLLQNLTIYPATGSQGWGFDKDGELLKAPLYDIAEARLTDQQMSVWRDAIGLLLNKYGLNKAVTNKKGEVVAGPAIIIDAGSQIILRLKERGFLRREIMEHLSVAFNKENLPITLKGIGHTSIRMTIKGINKSIAVKYHITKVCKDRFGFEPKPSEVLILGNSFDEGDDDRQMIIKGAKVFSVGHKPFISYLRGGIEFYPVSGWRGSDQLLAEFINVLLSIPTQVLKAKDKTEANVLAISKDTTKPNILELDTLVKGYTDEQLNTKAEDIRQKYPGIKIGIIGAALPTKEYTPSLGEQLGGRLRQYAADKGFIFTGGVGGVGVDVCRGIFKENKWFDDRFFVLLPEGMFPGIDYKKLSPSKDIQVAHIGRDMLERRIGMGKVADVLIALNGGGGTLHEAISALKSGKKVIVLNHGGAGSLLYNAKANNILLPNLIQAGLKPEHLENIILSDIDHIEEDLQKTLETTPAKEKSSLILGDPLSKALFIPGADGTFALNRQSLSSINSLSAAYDGLTLEIDIDTLIDTSKGLPQLKGYGFKEAVLALYKAQENKDIPQGLRIRLINLNPKLDREKIIKALGLTYELLKELVSILEIRSNQPIENIEPYLIKGSIRIVFEDNLRYWGKKIDVLVKKGNEAEVLSSLGLIVAALAKEPKFYQDLPQELKEYIIAVTDEKGNIALDDQQMLKQLIFKPIEKTKVDTQYLEKLDKANKELEGMV